MGAREEGELQWFGNHRRQFVGTLILMTGCTFGLINLFFDLFDLCESMAQSTVCDKLIHSWVIFIRVAFVWTSLDSSWRTLSKVFWVRVDRRINLGAKSRWWGGERSQTTKTLSERLGKFKKTGLFLIEFELCAHHSIALEVLYQHSFESNSIRTELWPQISRELASTVKLLTPEATLSWICGCGYSPIISEPKPKL